MKVLVLGSGAREHALILRLLADPDVTVVAAPGNPGIADLVPVHPLDLTDPAAASALARREQIDLTVVGPELPLSVGIADRFATDGLLLLGPSAAAARLETSKAFAKAFMARHAIPTASFETVESAEAARAVVRSGKYGFPIVLKADGLAAGKGVVIARDLAEADEAIAAAMTRGRFGDAGLRLVIEECLSGPEVSFFVVSDGHRAVPLGTAQDHKRIFDDDQGPNTGGMGAFAPSPLVDAALHERVMSSIVSPVIAGMAAEGHPFAGFLYVGLMLAVDGPKVIEFNVRLGDPEAQVILPLIREPLAPLLAAAARGALDRDRLQPAAEVAVGVVIASRGYPDSAENGRPIRGLEDAARRGVQVYHAGTGVTDGELTTAGGRVLTVVAQAPDFASAIDRAYDGVSAIAFDGMQYRRDIGRKATLGLPTGNR
jgi:phosphoribosylamine--glycine ligase